MWCEVQTMSCSEGDRGYGDDFLSQKDARGGTSPADVEKLHREIEQF